MPSKRNRSGLLTAMVLVCAVAGVAVLGVSDQLQDGSFLTMAQAQTGGTEPRPVTAEPAWAAAAPGKVQPKGGEVHINSPAPAVVRDVLVQVSDRVKAGDLLVRFEDDELPSKLSAAKAELGVRVRDRDGAPVTGAAKDRREAEDAAFSARSAFADAQAEFDRISLDLRKGTAAVGELDKARTARDTARDKAESERSNLARIVSTGKFPAYTREDAAVLAGRSEVLQLYNAIEKTKVRAPRNAMVLDVNAKQGEVSSGGTDTPLVTLGDTTRLQIRAEVEDRDLEKVFVGQQVTVKTETFQGRTFQGRVATVAKTLTSPQLGSRKRGLTDVDILEVIIDMDEGGSLIPGMRVDVLFKASEQAAKRSAVKEQ